MTTPTEGAPMNADRDRSEQPCNHPSLAFSGDAADDWTCPTCGSVVPAPVVHRCDDCPDCIHNGNKCCGCYDGVCCRDSAPPPPRSATKETGGRSGTGEAQGDAQERVERYAEPIHAYWCDSCCDGPAFIGNQCRAFARTVVAVADAEIAAVQEEADGWADSHAEAFGAWHRERARADRLAESLGKAVEKLAGLRQLAEEWANEPYPETGDPGWNVGYDMRGESDAEAILAILGPPEAAE